MDQDSLTKAIEGCTHVIHVASPVPGDSSIKKEKDMIEWAVNGIQYILKACLQNKV